MSKEDKAELMRLRGIIVDIDEHRRPYKEGTGVVRVAVSPMLALVHEARDIRLQSKPYDGQISEEDEALLGR